MAPDSLIAIRAKDASADTREEPVLRESHDDQASAGKEPQHKRIKVSQKHSRNEKVMETNNSSIVSKRSVERLYHPKPHFFRFFVKKPIRRSPLINRGYWLRMYAIEHVIANFLSEPTNKHKIVLNLGCGYDPLPFYWYSWPKKEGITFVDVDYPELMSKKKDVILEHHELFHLISPVQTDTRDPAVILCSDRYVAVGCDLHDTAELSRIFEGKLELNLGGCTVLCIAEVSMTYMDVDAADALIRWTAQHSDVKFCLLEQCLPHGDQHPFAQKMLKHFENLSTPLKCVRTYPTLGDQEARFLRAGYNSAHAWTLWDLWQDPSFVTTQKVRLDLNKAEQFDEWEEFAVFSSHYFLLEAVKSPCIPAPGNRMGYVVESQSSESQSDTAPTNEALILRVTSSTSNRRRRKFGAITSCSENTLGYHGGTGNQGRMQNTDRYRLSGYGVQCEIFPDPPPNIPARVCHTITRLKDGKDLLVGGRTSPDEALSACWLRSRDGWKAVGDLPIPLYRHCAVAVAVDRGDDHAGVLVFGGRTTGGVAVNSWLLWQETNGWNKLYSHRLSEDDGEVEPRFGATLAATHGGSGLLFGGITEEGFVCDGAWEWNIEDIGVGFQRMLLRLREDIQITPRMGACLVMSPVGFLLIGGIFKPSVPEEEVLCLSDGNRGDPKGPWEWKINPVQLEYGDSQPLLIGHAAHAAGNTVLIVGGGAVCFSFGAHWNEDIWTLYCSSGGEDETTTQRWVTDKNAPPNDRVKRKRQVENPRVPTTYATIPQEILRVRIDAARDFDRLMAEGRPFVMEDLDIGRCTSSWTADELMKKVDPYRIVTVHQAQDDHMNFQHKNFRYVKKQFGEFIREASNGSKQYLRSLAAEKPADQPACFYDDFPSLRDDFHLPEQLETVSRNHHGSPLRISGPVNMWLHYDVMANVLCQISGTKVVALYPPSDAVHFRIPPGSSTSPMDVWADEPKGRGIVNNKRPYTRATLRAGDILYIPPLWLHTASPMENLSVAINIFFKNFKTGYAAGRDVYGNRDLQAYENGRKSIEKMVKAFDSLPRDIGSVYLGRLADELKGKARAYRSEGV